MSLVGLLSKTMHFKVGLAVQLCLSLRLCWFVYTQAKKAFMEAIKLQL